MLLEVVGVWYEVERWERMIENESQLLVEVSILIYTTLPAPCRCG